MSVTASARAIEVADAALAGLAGAVALTAALGLLRLLQRWRVQRLARSAVEPEAVADAAVDAERDEAKLLNDVIHSAVVDVAGDQRLPEALVRGALLAYSEGGTPRILEGQAVNFDSMADVAGVGSDDSGVGKAVQTRSPVVTVFKDPTGPEPAQPSVRWTIAVPVLGPEGRPLWVLRVDGLVEERTADQLRSSVGHLLYYREVLELLLKSLARKK